MKVRGYLTVGAVGLFLVVSDLVQRTVVSALVRLVPWKREPVLAGWQRFMAYAMMFLVERVGGARLEHPPRIPGGPGVLVLMNHQSLMDIPLVVASMRDLHPKIVTRARYAHGKPLISHMVRLYQYPLVDPGATVGGQLRDLEVTAREAIHPFVLYPEGTRSRDGTIGGFRRGGIRRLLQARQWTVYLLVVDGFWKAGTLRDFLTSVSRIDGRIECRGPFVSPAPGQPVEDFVDRMHESMIETLERMREGSPERSSGRRRVEEGMVPGPTGGVDDGRNGSS